MSELVTVARVEEFPPGSTRVLEVGEDVVAVYNCDGDFHATQGKCLHLGGPLGDGVLEGCVVTCPWHGWQYDVRTGENEFDRALALRKYEVVVEDGEVKVAI